MARENKTSYVILGFLNHEAMTGYELKKRIDLSLSYFWETGFGQIYPTLSALEANGLVERFPEDSAQKLERIRYGITQHGREALREWLEQPVSQKTIKYEVLLKLFFGGELSAEQNIRTINAFAERFSQELPNLERFEQSLLNALPENPDHLYYLLTVRFGQKIFNAYESWAKESEELIRQYHDGGNKNE